MRQIFPNGAGDGANLTPGTYFNFALAHDGNLTSDGWTTSINKMVVAPAAGTVSDLHVEIETPASRNLVFTVQKNGSDTGATATILAGQTEGVSSGNGSVAAGDRISLELTVGGSGTESNVAMRWSMRWTGSTANEAIMGGSELQSAPGPGFPTSGATYFNCINAGHDDGWTFTEANRRFYCPMAGTIKSFYVYANNAPDGTGQWQLSIYKNGVVVAASVITYTAGQSGAKSVTGLSIPFVAGDYLHVTITPSGSFVGGNTGGSWGIMYSPAMDGESMIGGMTVNNLSTVQNTEQFGQLAGPMDIRSTELDTKQLIGEAAVVRNFRVHLATAPGTGQAREFRIRKNGINGNKVITIEETETSGVDDTNLETVVAGDEINLYAKATTSGVTASIAYWSAVLFIDPGSVPDAAVGGVSVQELPSNNPAVITAIKNVRQGAIFPEFIFAAKGGAGAAVYGLYKKSTVYGQHLIRIGPFSIGRRFRVARVVLRLGAALTDSMAATPRLYFDNESSSQNGMEITNVNYPNGERFVVLTEDSFEKNTEGKNNFFLEIQNTGAALLPIIMPVEIQVEIYDNPND